MFVVADSWWLFMIAIGCLVGTCGVRVPRVLPANIMMARYYANRLESGSALGVYYVFLLSNQQIMRTHSYLPSTAKAIVIMCASRLHLCFVPRPIIDIHSYNSDPTENLIILSLNLESRGSKDTFKLITSTMLNVSNRACWTLDGNYILVAGVLGAIAIWNWQQDTWAVAKLSLAENDGSLSGEELVRPDCLFVVFGRFLTTTDSRYVR